MSAGRDHEGTVDARTRQHEQPVLTPQQVLQLRGVDLGEFHFDVAVLCFRGREASRSVIDAFSATRVDRNILYGSAAYVGCVGDRRIVVLPEVIWGGPATAILVEELACLGVQVAVGYGAAGSLVSPEHIGKMLVAERALCSDGTSREYTDAPHVRPAPGLLRLATTIAAQEGVPSVAGAVHTTDALYQEWPDRIQRWREAGASFVNLETSPFYAVAAFRGIRAVYLGLVSDYVGDPGGWQHGFWSRPNLTDPLIVGLMVRLVETVELP